MRKRILIISSEPLDPDDTLSSTFELSQAQILQTNFETAIISVKVYNSVIQNLRSFVKSVLFFHSLKEIRRLGWVFMRSFIRFLAGKNYWCNLWIIEGVPVFEGHGFSWNNPTSEKDQIDLWVNSGKTAYLDYERQNGKPDLVHAHGRFMVAGLLALELKENYKLDYIYTEHSSRFPSGFVPASSIPLLNKIIDHCALYIAVSRPLLMKVYDLLDREIENAVVIPNVVDRIFEKPLGKPNSEGEIIFLNVCNLEHRKGNDVLLRAFKLAFHGNMSYRLIIVGDGPMRDDLEKLRDYLGLKEVVSFFGEATKFQVAEILDKVHLFVFPSRYETFGVAVIEALSRGCPVIATSCGGPEFIVKDHCGLIVEPDHEHQLVYALQEMAANYSKYNREDIRNYALNRFGSSSFLTYMGAVYNRLPIPPQQIEYFVTE
jgi:glycosyltransferase involved in cell wall biosynthesis